jgi:hypothetical protein
MKHDSLLRVKTGECVTPLSPTSQLDTEKSHLSMNVLHVHGLQTIEFKKDLCCAGIFNQSMGASDTSRVSYRPARLHRLAELVSWNRFLGSLKV